jgi:hypothetical protein
MMHMLHSRPAASKRTLPSVRTNGSSRSAVSGPARPTSLGYDFAQTPIFPRAGRHAPLRLHDGKSSCSPDTYGSADPEVDADGKFTGEVKITINDSAIKSPCVRECVVEHEEVHRRDLTPILKEIRACDVAAGNDDAKQGECNRLSNSKLPKVQQDTECNAYRVSYTCLTLEALDSKGPCSKSPHREEIRKHRAYEACELAKSRAARGGCSQQLRGQTRRHDHWCMPRRARSRSHRHPSRHFGEPPLPPPEPPLAGAQGP